MKVHRLCGGEQVRQGPKALNTSRKGILDRSVDPGTSLSSVLMQIPDTFVSLNDARCNRSGPLVHISASLLLTDEAEPLGAAFDIPGLTDY